MALLFADILNEIFEYLEDDKATLYSCLLVNRLWCEVSVRILWKSVRNYKTFFSFLPDESKEILYRNEIIISTQSSKPPLFNYVSFIKSFNISDIICNAFKNHRPFIPQHIDYNKKWIIAQEMFKLPISSLRRLHFCDPYLRIDHDSSITFTFPPRVLEQKIT
jgi:hypothetical protein